MEKQPGLLRDIQLAIHIDPSTGSPDGLRECAADRLTVSALVKGHGRLERRTLTSTTALTGDLDWPGVKQVCRSERERTLNGVKTTEVVSDVTSLSRSKANAATQLALVRDHWGAIEYGLHSVRDQALNEGHCMIFRDHAPLNLAALHNTTLNLLRRLGFDKLTATRRSFAPNPQRLFALFGYRNEAIAQGRYAEVYPGSASPHPPQP